MKEKVCEFLKSIPRGYVVTYGDVALHLGNKNLARYVGNILHANPDGDEYPCYRVVNSRGRLSAAYAFGGIEAQKRRLTADGIEVVNYTVDLEKYRYVPK